MRDKDFPDGDADKKAKKPKGSSSGGAVEFESDADADAVQQALGEMQEAKAAVAQEEGAQRVLNPMTKEPIVLPLDEASRMAACFPRADAALAASDRLPWSPALTFDDVAAALAAAAQGGNATMRSAVLANHDYLGIPAALLLTGLKLNAQCRGAADETAALVAQRSLYLLAEATVNAPFRQLMRESEQRLATLVNNFPALEREAARLAKPELASAWVLLRAAVSTWEDKFVFDQVAVSKLEQSVGGLGGGSVAAADEGKLGMAQERLANTQSNMELWQRMAASFGAVPEAAQGVLPELLFLEQALALPSETEVRFFAAKTFCSGPTAALDEPELRFRVRRLATMVARLNAANYGSLAAKLTAMSEALDRGTPDECDYFAAARRSAKLDFQTYEMPQGVVSSLREWEARGKTMSSDKRGQKKKLAQSAKSKLAERPQGLDWFHTAAETDAIVRPEFARTTLDKSIEDPETWDSTLEVRAAEAEADAKLAAAEANGQAAATAFGGGLDEAALARLADEAEDHFAEDEAFLARALELAAPGHVGHALDLAPGAVSESAWAEAVAAAARELGREFNSPKAAP